MGSARHQYLVRAANELHVAYDTIDKCWWVVGKYGSYGSGRHRPEAVNLAIDASASAYHGEARIVVHDIYGGVAVILTRVRHEPSSQVFQDSVP